MPVGATCAATLTRRSLSAVVQMCRTFQKSPVNSVVRACRDGMPGTLLSQPRCRMPSSATLASPKRSDAWLMEAVAVTGTLAFRRPAAMDVDLINLADRKRTQALEETERSTGWNADER